MNEIFLQLDRATVVRECTAILKDITLNIPIGEHVVILGPNGAGKSTLLKLISGELRPIMHDGVPIRLFGEERWNIFDMRKLIGFVSNDLQAAYQKDCTGLEVILSGFFGSIGIYDDVSPELIEKAKDIASKLGLSELLSRSISVMSSGEARRFLIARALVNGPKVIVFDEPTNSLDLKAKAELLGTLRELAKEHCTILLITHNIDEIIPEIDRVIMLKGGKVFDDGRLKQVMSPKNISGLFDIPIEASEKLCAEFHKK
jgi:iron complex transport system ATP-binding protein